MKIQFDRLFHVEVLHNYYKSGKGDEFVIEPSSTCQSLLQNYGLLFKKVPYGFLVLYEYEGDKNNPYPVKPIENDLKFTFTLSLKKPYFINYSALPLDSEQDQIYYGHNLNDNPKNSKLLLTSDMISGYLTGSDRIYLRPQVFQYTFKSSNSKISVEIVDELNNSVYKKNVSVFEGIASFPVDLRSYRPGKFTLKIDGVQELVFYADSELIGKNIFAIVEIFKNSSVPSAYRFTDTNNNVVEKTYTLRIDKRSTYWKYYITLKYNSQIAPEDLSIAHPDPLVGFTRQVTELLPDGLSAAPFLSDTELALVDEPVRSIQLHKAGSNGNAIVLIDHLPNPSVMYLKPDNTDNKIYSEIFFYV